MQSDLKPRLTAICISLLDSIESMTRCSFVVVAVHLFVAVDRVLLLLLMLIKVHSHDEQTPCL